MRRVSSLSLIASVVLLVVAGSATALAGAGPRAKQAVSARDLLGVNFTSTCRFSHQNSDDPIVYPDQPGKSHLHQFFGNDSTDAYSTLGSMLTSTTSCRRPADTAGYWTPALLDGATPVTPLAVTVYYRRGTLRGVRPFPAGFKMIAGDSHATTPQSLRVTYWNCGVGAGVPDSSSIPTCPAGSNLRLHVRFPSCWDGQNLDSADHKSHMAYAVGHRCPADHPVAVPAISLIAKYAVLGGPSFSLSSMGQYSGHADFFNAWNQLDLKRLVNRCLNGLRHCGPRD
jgi:hypothetical protein